MEKGEVSRTLLPRFFVSPPDGVRAPEPGCVALGSTPNKLPADLLSGLGFPLSLQADLNTNMEDGGSSFYGVSSQYESPENMIITCSTKVCSFGKQVVEKVEVGAPVHLLN